MSVETRGTVRNARGGAGNALDAGGDQLGHALHRAADAVVQDEDLGHGGIIKGMEKSAWRGFADFCLAVFWRFYEERALQTAGSLTYTTLLSLVPLITVALAVATAFPVFDETIDALQLFLLENFLPDADGIDTIAEQITAFTSNAGRLTAIGLVFFFVTAVMLMMTIDTSLNRLFRVQRSRPMLQQVLMYWAVITLGPVLIGVQPVDDLVRGRRLVRLAAAQHRGRRGARRAAVPLHLRRAHAALRDRAEPARARRATR